MTNDMEQFFNIQDMLQDFFAEQLRKTFEESDQ